jgi:hypothetical protein
MRWLIADFSPRRSGFSPKLVHLGCGIGRLAQVQVFLQGLVFPLPVIIPVIFHSHVPSRAGITGPLRALYKGTYTRRTVASRATECICMFNVLFMFLNCYVHFILNVDMYGFLEIALKIWMYGI